MSESRRADAIARLIESITKNKEDALNEIKIAVSRGLITNDEALDLVIDYDIKKPKHREYRWIVSFAISSGSIIHNHDFASEAEAREFYKKMADCPYIAIYKEVIT